MLLAIDPGIDLGWALFDACTLYACGLNDPPAPVLVSHCVIERPTVYPHSKADPNNLITLAITVGRMVERYSRVTIDLPQPRTWKGQVPKDIHEERTRRTLTPRETAIVVRGTTGIAASKHNNVWDAIALGLWALKRAR